MDRKYIIVKDEFGSEVPVLFGATLVHADVARRFRGGAVSAGFFSIFTEGSKYGEEVVFSAYGRSESLNLDSRGDIDSKLIMRTFCETY